MKYVLLLLLALVVSVPIQAFGQSGRTRRTETAKPQPSPQASPQASPTAAEENDEIRESSTAPGGETIEGDVVRFDTSLVTVPVSVLDRGGRFVPTMRRSDFHIYENGVEQKIAYFATSDQPFTVVLLLDTSGSTEFRLEDIQDAAITFVSKLKPEDSVMVISFDDRIQVLSKPTTNRDQIERAIRRSRTGGGTRLYDAVDQVLMKHLLTISGRKAVVLFTDGVDTTSHSASYNKTIHEAEESDAPIYTVDYDTSGTGGTWGHGTQLPSGRGGVIFGIPVPVPTGPTGGPMGMPNPGDYRRANDYLHALSNSTGGRFYSADSLVGIGQAFTWIAEELSRQYSIGYYPQVAGKAGERRSIKVKVEQSEYVVKSRDSFVYSERRAAATDAKTQQTDKKPYTGGR